MKYPIAAEMLENLFASTSNLHVIFTVVSVVVAATIGIAFFSKKRDGNNSDIVWISENGGPHFATPRKVECDKTVKLEGTQNERILQILKAAGWFPERTVDISVVEDFYKKYDAILTEGAKNFYREFYGIAENWWVAHHFNPAWSCDVSFNLMADYISDYDDFNLNVPDKYDNDVRELLKGDCFCDELPKLTAMAQEAFSYVGEIGYYYQSHIFVGESGRIYKFNGDHIEQFAVFASIFDFLEHDLEKLNLEYVTALNNAEWESMRKS